MPTNPAAVLAIQVDANTLQANAALARTQTQLKTTAATANASTAVMKKALLGVGAVAIGAGVALFKIGEEFDKASDTIRTKTGATGKELGKLEQNFKNVVSSVPVDFDTAAQAVAGLNQRLDLTGRPLERLAKQISALSKITGTDIQENIESITRLFGDWSVKSKNQTGTLDKLFRLTQVTGIGFSDLSRLMVQFGSPLRQLGFGFNESAAMFARFEKEGVNMQTLLPGLRMALKNIAVPTDDLSSLFKQLGISTKDPHDALLQIFDVLSKDKVKEADQTLLASSVFGGRAWADMKAAVEEGRFEFDDLIKTMKGGNETIRGSERSTRDFSEQWQLFKNRVMVWLEPLAATVFKGLGDAMKELSRLMQGKGGFAGAIGDVADALKDFWNDSAIFREAMHLMFDITKQVWAGIKDIFAGQIKIIRGIVKVISGVLTGNFGRAWDGVKDIFKGSVQAVLGIFRAMTAPFRVIGAKIGGVLVDAFKDATHAIVRLFGWMKDKILGIFNDLKNAIGDAMSWIQNAVNDALVALGIKDKISFTPPPAGPRGPTSSYPAGPGGPTGRQLGGLAATVPGNSSGDRHMLTLNGAPIAKVESNEGIFVGNRNLMAVLDKANAQVPRFAGGGGLQPGIARLAKWAGDQYGLSISSGLRPGTGSFHNTGEAVDLVPPSMKATEGIFKAFKSQLEELFYDPWGGWDSGHMIGAIGDHMDHIHAAILGAGKGGPSMSQRIGRGMLTGKGPLSQIGQGLTDRMTKAANHFLSKQGVSMPHMDVGGGSLDKTQLAKLWSGTGAGGDPRLMAAIALAESGGNPAAHGPPDGRGLWQIEWPVWGSTLGKFGNPYDPVANAQMAHEVLKQQGLGAWVVYNTGAYQQFMKQGGMAMPPFAGSFGDGGIVPGPVGSPRTVIAHGGERIGAGAMKVIVEHRYVPGSGWLEDIIDTRAEVVVDEYRQFDKSEARRR